MTESEYEKHDVQSSGRLPYAVRDLASLLFELQRACSVQVTHMRLQCGLEYLLATYGYCGKCQATQCRPACTVRWQVERLQAMVAENEQ